MERGNSLNRHEAVDVQIENEVFNAVREAKNRVPELVTTCVFLTLGLFFYGIGLSSFWPVMILLFGALWNFFTDSNKLFACIFAFCLCIPYALISIEVGMYGHAFLHILFYLPTQLIYYIENQHKEDVSILPNKRLEVSGFVGSVIAGLIMIFGLSMVLYNLDTPFFIFDSVSVVMLAFAVFLVNGRYKEYWLVRLFAVMFSSLSWLVVGFLTKWADGTILFALLFAMYFIVDFIKYILWKKENAIE